MRGCEGDGTARVKATRGCACVIVVLKVYA